MVIFIWQLSENEGRMEYYHYNMNNAGFTTEFQLHSLLRGMVTSTLYYNDLCISKLFV